MSDAGVGRGVPDYPELMCLGNGTLFVALTRLGSLLRSCDILFRPCKAEVTGSHRALHDAPTKASHNKVRIIALGSEKTVIGQKKLAWQDISATQW
jgi:hypothetical protein